MKKLFSCKFKLISTLMISVLSILLISTTVLADTTSPRYYTPTIYGHMYSFTSEVWNRYTPGMGYTVEAVANVEADTSVPIGYMGAQARLYNSSGSLKAASGMTYNPVATWTFWVYSPSTNVAGQYYTQNLAEFYNGNGYTRYTGYKSPYQTLSSSTFINETETSEEMSNLLLLREYPINNKGETYGSALSVYTIGVEPDLISAIGTNGVKGYVRADNLTSNISTIAEAIEQNGENGEINTIPLYDVDGMSVLGEFELITNYESVTNAS